jgi:outer membrane lipoprotein SlyB
VQTVKLGVVESVRQVKLEGTKSPVGTIAGGVIGGVAGSTVGQGSGSAIMAAIGAVAGGLAGSAAEEGLTRKDGLEITVKLENGTLVAIVQEADDKFVPGEKVRLVESGGTTRVSH